MPVKIRYKLLVVLSGLCEIMVNSRIQAFTNSGRNTEERNVMLDARHMTDTLLLQGADGTVDSNDNGADEVCVFDVVEKAVTIRQPPGLRRNLGRLSAAWNMDKAKKDEFKAMFSSTSNYVSVFDNEFYSEICFSFWGFVKNEDARQKLLEFIFWCLQPRFYTFSETRPHQIEAFMIVKLDKLQIKRDKFEDWIDKFFECMQMSAGTLIFTKYLDDQMISCIQRIEHGVKMKSNINTEWNKDFRILYERLSHEKKSGTWASDITGLDFTHWNFVESVRETRRLRRIVEQLTHEQEMQRRQIASYSAPSNPGIDGSWTESYHPLPSVFRNDNPVQIVDQTLNNMTRLNQRNEEMWTRVRHYVDAIESVPSSHNTSERAGDNTNNVLHENSDTPEIMSQQIMLSAWSDVHRMRQFHRPTE